MCAREILCPATDHLTARCAAKWAGWASLPRLESSTELVEERMLLHQHFDCVLLELRARHRRDSALDSISQPVHADRAGRAAGQIH
jgi:hypothetical protein